MDFDYINTNWPDIDIFFGYINNVAGYLQKWDGKNLSDQNLR